MCSRTSCRLASTKQIEKQPSCGAWNLCRLAVTKSKFRSICKPALAHRHIRQAFLGAWLLTSPSSNIYLVRCAVSIFTGVYYPSQRLHAEIDTHRQLNINIVCNDFYVIYSTSLRANGLYMYRSSECSSLELTYRSRLFQETP
jgi:hypothetical protein